MRASSLLYIARSTCGVAKPRLMAGWLPCTTRVMRFGTSATSEAVRTERDADKKYASPLSAAAVLGGITQVGLHPQDVSRTASAVVESDEFTQPSVWPKESLSDVPLTHDPPRFFVDKLALWTVRTLRSLFDLTSGYTLGHKLGLFRFTEGMWLNRIIFLETVAGVPGMVGAMVRHLHSLRRMERDHGWIHTLLDEAENERLHLLTAINVKQPGKLFRWAVIATQGIYTNFFFLAYLVSPHYCHRFVGYLEEEAVKTYTLLLEDIDTPGSPVAHWKTTSAPALAMKYWRLTPDATLRDVFLNIRADEAQHRVVNHKLAGTI